MAPKSILEQLSSMRASDSEQAKAEIATGYGVMRVSLPFVIEDEENLCCRPTSDSESEV